MKYGEVMQSTSSLLDAEIKKLKHILKITIKIEAMEKLEGKSSKIDDTYKKDLISELSQLNTNIQHMIKILTPNI